MIWNARQGKWADAREKFKNVEFAIASLPLDIQRIVTMEAMRASLEVKDYAGASKRRSELERVKRIAKAEGLWDDGRFRDQIALLEVDIVALEMMVLRVLSAEKSGKQSLDVAGLRRHLSTYSKAEVDTLLLAGVPAGFGSDDVDNDSGVSGATVSDALDALKTSVDSKVASALVGAVSGIATLDGAGKLTTAQIPATLTSPFQFQGAWNASTNTPALVSSVGTAGHLYRVSVAGTTDLDGEASWAVGDELYFGGGVWNKLGASQGSTTINLPSASTDTRITLLGITNGNSSKYLVAATADGRVLVWGDTANFAFNPVGDRYAHHLGDDGDGER